MTIIWSLVFINVLNSMVGICLGISLGVSISLILKQRQK